MTGKTDLDRRTVLRAITAASGIALAAAVSAKPASAQTGKTQAVTGPSDFEPVEVKTKDNSIFLRRYGSGSPVLLVHGFPRSSLMWRFVAPLLAKNHTVIAVDLRGYGQSGIPSSTDDHFAYSKRAMADELVEVMDKLGFSKFAVVGHDRGARVSYRMTLDHPEKVQRLAVLDAIPISEGWGHADARFALAYWPWTLLAQKAPLPERYLAGDPDAIFENTFGHGSFGPDIRAEYTATYHDKDRIHAVCEEFRAAASIDIEHDRKDQEASRRIGCPVLHLWGAGGPLDTFYEKDGGPLGIWRKWADNVQGRAMQGGHFFPEENPAETAELLIKFLPA
ncbi:alpha/beta hydrolase [Rhizobium sp. CNPSo 4039]|uniref:alpha/beta fold hydrolase n=1 Tax=Rhizobium sp. CNPSo 4039 TaxID=3021409 RepID=UPI00254DFB55|nr:alpha/beta hydrolase [Rhizobium sp. CNPSo 4039]MDK4717511.1 alpha/beta hydrolase [Rhizobium sp. CNPSo 4039]